jgi:uncharacterized protein with HEPN domain
VLIKLGEAAKILAERGLQAPVGINWRDAAKQREKLAHHYSVIDREVTWQTLSVGPESARFVMDGRFGGRRANRSR